MKGAASTLVQDENVLDSTTRKDLAFALWEETDRLDRLVRNLLDMTRLESGAVRIKKEWQSIEEVIGASFNRIESRLGDRVLTARVDADVLAPFDPVLVEQLLVNLLENALKYTPDATPIEVELSSSEREVVVEVADRGPGVPEQERERIFDKFHRGPSERTKGGVGLGLTICRAIVVAHGGRIWVANRPDGGAAFKFALPLEGKPPVGGSLPEITETAEADA
jgi:two-component system sensor histidine kinase KdpD